MKGCSYAHITRSIYSDEHNSFVVIETIGLKNKFDNPNCLVYLYSNTETNFILENKSVLRAIEVDSSFTSRIKSPRTNDCYLEQH